MVKEGACCTECFNEIYDPKCGSDGVTYQNQCNMEYVSLFSLSVMLLLTYFLAMSSVKFSIFHIASSYLFFRQPAHLAAKSHSCMMASAKTSVATHTATRLASRGEVQKNILLSILIHTRSLITFD